MGLRNGEAGEETSRSRFRHATSRHLPEILPKQADQWRILINQVTLKSDDARAIAVASGKQLYIFVLSAMNRRASGDLFCTR